MRSRNRCTPSRGFILLEALLALALAGAAFVGAVTAARSTAHWLQSSRAVVDALPTVADALGMVSAQATSDFFGLRTSFAPDSPGCVDPLQCDGLRRSVTDLSRCAKWVEVSAERRFIGFPVTATGVGTYLADFADVAALGGDCELLPPTRDWSQPFQEYAVNLDAGNPTGLDAFEGNVYVTTDAPPYLRIVVRGVEASFSNGFIGNGPFTAIDVSKDLFTGRVYAFVTAVSPQLQIIDVTDPTSPELVGSDWLRGVTLTGPQAEGWRITTYDGIAYVTARYMLEPNRELHLFDVRDRANPRELGNGTAMGTSVYGMTVREQVLGDTKRRVLYAAATLPSGELRAYDVTDPAAITPLASCDLPGAYQATSLVMIGPRLFVGRESVPSGGADLYAFDAQDPSSPGFCTPLASTDITTDGYSRHVQALAVTGPFLLVATSNTTNAHGQLQIRRADGADMLSLLGTFPLALLAENALDVSDDRVYLAGTGGSMTMHALTAPSLSPPFP